jgi:hypothetical protein
MIALPFDGVAGLLKDVLDRFVPDPAQKLAALEAAQAQAFQLATGGTFAERAELQQSAGQVTIDTAEASSSSPFASGWRPFIGWTCGAGFAVQFIVAPLATWVAGLVGHPLTFPPLDLATMLPLLGGMLGLGTLRTVEKVKGAA